MGWVGGWGWWVGVGGAAEQAAAGYACRRRWPQPWARWSSSQRHQSRWYTPSSCRTKVGASHSGDCGQGGAAGGVGGRGGWGKGARGAGRVTARAWRSRSARLAAALILCVCAACLFSLLRRHLRHRPPPRHPGKTAAGSWQRPCQGTAQSFPSPAHSGGHAGQTRPVQARPGKANS